MTKIVHILSDSNIGGAGHQMLALLKQETGISRSKFDITVILPTGALLTPALKAEGITCVELPHIAEKSFSLKAVGLITKELKRIKPKIVHTHAALSGRVAAKLYGKCTIVHTRHSVFEPKTWQTKAPMRWALGAINNALSHHIIAVSPAAAQNLTSMGTSPSKIHNIFNGMPPIAPPKDVDQLRTKYNIPQNAFVVAQIARLTEVKGQHYVLDGAKKTPDAIYLLAGSGNTHQELQQRIKAEGITNVRLLGFVSEVEEILAIMDVQISASYGTEATSLALVQGMSLGKPAIATNYGGNPYVIKHMENGLVIPTHNPDAIASAVLQLQSDKNMYNKMHTKSLDIYKSTFTVDKMVADTVKVYSINLQ